MLSYLQRRLRQGSFYIDNSEDSKRANPSECNFPLFPPI